MDGPFNSHHIATHNSYACVWAESLDRRALIDGMKRRHSYAATDNIILDVRSGDHIGGGVGRNDRQPLRAGR